MSTREQLEKIKLWIDMSDGFGGVQLLRKAIGEALSVREPMGDPGALRGQGAGAYTKAASQADVSRTDVDHVARQGLPEVWVGETSERASNVVTAASRELDRTVTVFQTARQELDVLADALERAQEQHRRGLGPLRQAAEQASNLPPFGIQNTQLMAVRDLARTGVGDLLAAVDTAEDAGRRATNRLNDLASQARAARMDTGHLSAVDKLLLGETATPGGAHERNVILSAEEAERAADRLDSLNDGERQRMDTLLDNAKSPQERAYLMKALAVGHPVDAVERFGGLIHAHGDDPVWLRDHLTPIHSQSSSTRTGRKVAVEYEGAAWTQGQRPTCVASSTVMAHAMIDPLYSLQLTTGGRPGDPAFDNPKAFSERLTAEQVRVYDDGRPAYADWPGVGYDGMTTDEGLEVANNEIGPHTGAEYYHAELDTTQKREDILPMVEQAVDEGRPVPIQVYGDGGHQMLIIGHEGDKLQIYNPWGETVWVSEDDFVNGHMAKASDGRLPDVGGVHIPVERR